MNEPSSTKQIDAIWILHDASSNKCYLEAIFSDFEAFIGPEMRGVTTVIITRCDTALERGDYFQYPKVNPFKLPEEYDKVEEDILKELFWVKIMQPDQPFEFAKHKMLHS